MSGSSFSVACLGSRWTPVLANRKVKQSILSLCCFADTYQMKGLKLLDKYVIRICKRVLKSNGNIQVYPLTKTSRKNVSFAQSFLNTANKTS